MSSWKWGKSLPGRFWFKFLLFGALLPFARFWPRVRTGMLNCFRAQHQIAQMWGLPTSGLHHFQLFATFGATDEAGWLWSQPTNCHECMFALGCNAVIEYFKVSN